MSYWKCKNCGEDCCVRAELKRLRDLVDRAKPFARHVSVCENHDGSKFQELAETWLDATEEDSSNDG